MKKIFIVKPFTLVLLTIASTILLIVIFIKGLEHSLLAYFVYPFSFYSLTELVIYIVLRVKKIKERIVNILNKNNKTREILNDKDKRDFSILLFSFSFNAIVAIVKIVIGILISSYWVFANGLLYLAFALLRVFLIKSWNIEIENQKKKIKIVIILLSVLSISYLMVFLDMFINYSSLTYPYYLIYLVALYAFYNVGFSLKDMFSKKIEVTPIIFAYRCIKIANALVSIIFLESSMIAEFGSNSNSEKTLLLISGIVVVFILQLLSYLLARFNKEKET